MGPEGRERWTVGGAGRVAGARGPRGPTPGWAPRAQRPRGAVGTSPCGPPPGALAATAPALPRIPCLDPNSSPLAAKSLRLARSRAAGREMRSSQPSSGCRASSVQTPPAPPNLNSSARSPPPARGDPAPRSGVSPWAPGHRLPGLKREPGRAGDSGAGQRKTRAR